MAGGFKRTTDYNVVDPADLPDDAVVYAVLPSESTPALIDRKWTWANFKTWLATFVTAVAAVVDNTAHKTRDGKEHADVVLNNTHRNLDNTLLSAKSAAYTITDVDHIDVINMTTGASNRTVTLPTAADNTDREITLIKVDIGVGYAILDGEGIETINGTLTWEVTEQWGRIKVKCDGSNWIVLEQEGCIYEVIDTATNSVSTDWTECYSLSGISPGTYKVEYYSLSRSTNILYATLALTTAVEDDVLNTSYQGNSASTSHSYDIVFKSRTQIFSVVTTLYLNGKSSGSSSYLQDNGFIRATRIR